MSTRSDVQPDHDTEVYDCSKVSTAMNETDVRLVYQRLVTFQSPPQTWHDDEVHKDSV